MNKAKKILIELLSVFSTGLGRKIALPFMLVLAMLLMPPIFINRLENVTDESNAAVQNKDLIHEQLYDIQGGMRQEQVAIYEMVYEQKTAAVGDFRSGAIRVQQANEAAIQNIENPEESSLLNDCLILHEQIQGVVESELIPATMSGNINTLAAVAVEERVQPLFDQAADIRVQLNDLYKADKQAAIFRQVESREFASEMMWASILLFLGLGLVIATYSTRKLLWPVKQISEASLQMARGDLSQRVEVKGHDELATLGDIFNDMADSLERQTTQLVNEKARIRSIHQSIGDGIIVIDRGGVILSVNPAAERALGRTAKELERTTNLGIPELQRAMNARVLEPDMVKCWVSKSCAKSDCPSHGSSDHRCWLQCGTFCYNQIQGTFKQKRDACERCDVFIRNAVIQFELEIDARVFSGQVAPILDDFGQEGGRTIVFHDVSELRRAKEDAEHSAAQLAVLNSVSRAAAGSLELDTILESSLASMIGGTMADSGFIHINGEDSTTMLLAASQGIDEPFRTILAKLPKCASEGGCPGHVVESGRSVLENKLGQLGATAQAAVDAGFHSYVGAPLIVKKEIVGVVSMLADEPDAFTSDDKDLLSMVGAKVGMAVENARLFSKTIDYAKQEKSMGRIAAALTSSFDLEENFDNFDEELRVLVPLDRMSVVHKVHGKNRVLTPSDIKPLIDFGNTNPSLQNTAASWVIRNKVPYITGDIEKELRFDEQSKLVDLGMKSQLNMPLIARGEALGSLNLASFKTNAYHKETVEMLRPITDQLALALANQQLFEDISQAKAEWETTFDAASEGIVMVSKDHHITRMNNTAAAMLGGRVEDLVGRSCHEVVHNTDCIPDTCLMRQTLTTSATSRGEQENEDGSTLELIVDAVYDEQGEFVGSVHFMRDITEAKKLRQQLIQSEKMVAVGQLVAGVAHEINNPLTGVMGYAQLLQTRDIDEQARQDAESINREAERASRIVRHLLSFAREHQPERKSVDINAVLRESMELKAYELKVNNVLMEADLDPGLPLTTTDPHQLQQVFLNLISNAEQAMLDDSSSGVLKIVTRFADDKIRIAFTDNGPGVPEEFRDRVFEPFFTTKDVGKGTGLGLSICYGVVEDNNGHIWVEPTKDRGTTIIIELPVVATVSQEETQDGPVGRGRLGKILLVDDEAAIRQVLTETLRRAGHEVETAMNGEVALKMLKQKHYDCIVSDVKMPGMDGPKLHQAVRAVDPKAAGSFIFISGDTVSQETSSYLETVDNPTLAKPFEPGALERALQKMLATTGNGGEK